MGNAHSDETPETTLKHTHSPLLGGLIRAAKRELVKRGWRRCRERGGRGGGERVIREQMSSFKFESEVLAEWMMS